MRYTKKTGRYSENSPPKKRRNAAVDEDGEVDQGSERADDKRKKYKKGKGKQQAVKQYTAKTYKATTPPRPKTPDLANTCKFINSVMEIKIKMILANWIHSPWKVLAQRQSYKPFGLYMPLDQILLFNC